MSEIVKQKWESKQGDSGTTKSKDPDRVFRKGKWENNERGELEEKCVIERKRGDNFKCHRRSR